MTGEHNANPGDVPELQHDPRYDELPAVQRRALDRAWSRWHTHEGEAHVDASALRWPGDSTGAICGVVIKRGKLAGRPCPNPAGDKTIHLGFGPCWAHNGALRRGRAEGAWVAAHGFARQLNINPWDALLMAVRIAAGKVAYIESVIGQARSDLEIEGRALEANNSGTSNDALGGSQARLLVHPDTGEPLGVGEYRDLTFWVQQSQLWHDRLAKTAKMAIDAGVATWQVQNMERDAANIARVLNATIEALEDDITEDQVARIRAIMRDQLLKIGEEARLSGALDGIGDQLELEQS